MVLHPLLLLLLGASASAQESPDPERPTEPSPVARCAAAAAGTEVEICLQLALDHPEEVDGIATALRAHIARRETPDSGLLLALLALVDDRTAPTAARQIAELRDNRGLPALVACAEDRAIEVSETCIEAVAPFDEGREHLTRWMIDLEQPLELRLASARTLGRVGTPEAGDVLVDTLRRPQLPAPLRREILDTLRTHYPDRSPALEGQVAANGSGWLALGGGFGMAYAMGAAGHLGRTNLEALGWVTGAVGGTTGGWLYGQAWPMEAHDASYIAIGGIQGTTSGMLLGQAIGRTPDSLYGGGLAGLAIGYGTTLATHKLHPGTVGDSLEASLVAGSAAVAATSLTHVVQVQRPTRDRVADGPNRGALAGGVALASGAVIGHAVAPVVDLGPGDGGLMVLSAAYGTAVGSLLPLGPDTVRADLPLAGLGAGVVAGYALAPALELSSDVQGAAWMGAIYGGVLGSGVGLVIDPESYDAVAGSSLAFGTAGMVAGGLLARVDQEPVDDRDAVLVGLTTTWATWQAVGWGAAARVEPGAVGWLVMAPPAVGAITAVATPALDVPVPDAMAATSLGLWGAYGGGVAAELTGNPALPWSLIGSNLGLAGGALVMSPLVGAPPVVIGVADAGGVLGGSVAALGAAVVADNPDTVLAASLVGAGAGLAGGAALGASWKKGGTRDMARAPMGKIPGRWLVRPDVGPNGRMGGAIEVSEW